MESAKQRLKRSEAKKPAKTEKSKKVEKPKEK